MIFILLILQIMDISSLIPLAREYHKQPMEFSPSVYYYSDLLMFSLYCDPNKYPLDNPKYLRWSDMHGIAVNPLFVESSAPLVRKDFRVNILYHFRKSHNFAHRTIDCNLISALHADNRVAANEIRAKYSPLAVAANVSASQFKKIYNISRPTWVDLEPSDEHLIDYYTSGVITIENLCIYAKPHHIFQNPDIKWGDDFARNKNINLEVAVALDVKKAGWNRELRNNIALLNPKLQSYLLEHEPCYEMETSMLNWIYNNV